MDELNYSIDDWIRANQARSREVAALPSNAAQLLGSINEIEKGNL